MDVESEEEPRASNQIGYNLTLEGHRYGMLSSGLTAPTSKSPNTVVVRGGQHSVFGICGVCRQIPTKSSGSVAHLRAPKMKRSISEINRSHKKAAGTSARAPTIDRPALEWSYWSQCWRYSRSKGGVEGGPALRIDCRHASGSESPVWFECYWCLRISCWWKEGKPGKEMYVSVVPHPETELGLDCSVKRRGGDRTDSFELSVRGSSTSLMVCCDAGSEGPAQISICLSSAMTAPQPHKANRE